MKKTDVLTSACLYVSFFVVFSLLEVTISKRVFLAIVSSTVALLVKEAVLYFKRRSTERERSKEKQLGIISFKDGHQTWEDILFVFEHYSAIHEVVKNNLTKMSLLDLVQISHLKQSIVWNNNTLSKALSIIEENTVREFDDEKLKQIALLVKELEQNLKSDYKGAQKLNLLIQNNAPKTLKISQQISDEIENRVK